ncbi:Uncharacterised protein, partial [Mycoplasmoides gallisepticum]
MYAVYALRFDLYDPTSLSLAEPICLYCDSRICEYKLIW